MPRKRLVTLALPVTLLALWGLVSAFGPQKTAPEYRIMVDVSQKEVDELTDEGWEFAGYLGRSVTGDSSDETLWKRTAGR